MLGVSPESQAMLARQAKFRRKQSKQNKRVEIVPHYNRAQWDSVCGKEYRK